MPEPVPQMWMQETLVPVEHLELRLRLGVQRRQGTATIGVKVLDVDGDDLIGLYAGPILEMHELEERALTTLRELLVRLELDKDSQEPF